MFAICGNKGFQMTIGKRILSVQFGPGNYADNYDGGIMTPLVEGARSSTAEVAVMGVGKDGFHYHYTGGDVGNRWTMDQVVELIAKLQVEKAEDEAMPYVGKAHKMDTNYTIPIIPMESNNA
jgi:hypothetical protein